MLDIDNKLKEQIRRAFPIRKNIPDFIDKEIEILKDLYLSTNLGREKTEIFLKEYLKENQQEYYFKKCERRI